MSRVKTFDPSKLSLIVGPQAIQGFHEGTYLVAKPGSARVSKLVGGDGSVTRIMSTDRSATIEITLAQSSPSNDYLSTMALLDSLTGTGVVPVLLRDGSGRTVIASAEGWVAEAPEVGFEKAQGAPRKWVIDVADTDFFVGGN